MDVHDQRAMPGMQHFRQACHEGGACSMGESESVMEACGQGVKSSLFSKDDVAAEFYSR